MKVLQINSVCGTGSTGRIAVDIYNKLKETGNEGKIFYGFGQAKNIDLSDTYKYNTKFGYYVHNAISRFTDRAGFYSYFKTKDLIKHIKEYNPDLIHLHNLHGYHINIKVLFEFLKKYGKPVVWTLHDCWAFTGHCAYPYSAECNKWKTGCYNCPLKNNYPKSYLFDQSKRNYKQKKYLFNLPDKMHIVTPSEWFAGEVKQSFLKNFDISFIHNGMDLSVFKPQDSNFREKYGLNNKTVILGVGNIWNKNKGLYDFIKLSEELDDSYKVVLVGVDDEIKKLLPDNILAIKRTYNLRELVDIYSAADIFVNPSIQETFGMVTAEALACGTPAVVYDKTAVPEVVDEKSGVVVKAGDFDSLLSTIINFPKFHKENIINRARFFDKNLKYNQYIKIYEEMLNDK